MKATRDSEGEFYEPETYDEDVRRISYFAPGWIANHVGDLSDLEECRVLDLGCGTGLAVNALRVAGKRVRADGVDLSSKMIEYARATGRYESVYAHDLNSPLPDLPSGAYDLVVAFGFLELLVDVYTCLSECHRVLKRNGRLWASFRRFEADDEASPPRHAVVKGMSICGYSAAEVLHMMRSLGMCVTSMDAVVGHITNAGFDYPCHVVRAYRIS